MQILSTIKDKRINSLNLLVECTFEEYLRFAPSVIKNNEFQRKRVKTSKTVYALLRDDLERGCVMPPIVLAISDVKNSKDGDQLLEEICADTQKVMILDGLQRTYTLIDADSEVKETEKYTEFLSQKLRLEVYMEINKFGVLYRMLTLNTGQTPMSVRHQLEMMYRDMLDEDLDGVKIIRDTDGSANPDDDEFVFKNTIDGFNSYLNRKEFPIDREELLDNIKVLEKMSEEAAGKDIYREYVMCYASLWDKTRNSITAVIPTKQLSPYLTMPGISEAYLAIVPLKEFVEKVLMDADKNLRVHIFEENVRAFLGKEIPVNKQIKSTLEMTGMQHAITARRSTCPMTLPIKTARQKALNWLSLAKRKWIQAIRF